MDNGHVKFVLRRCAFLANVASGYDGGAINFDKSLDSAIAKISACTFEGNKAQRDGGAIVLLGNATATLTSCSLSSNSAPVPQVQKATVRMLCC